MWVKARALGELHILTRASYIALIVVPIIAGIWPALHLHIGHPYRESIQQQVSDMAEQLKHSPSPELSRRESTDAESNSAARITGNYSK